MANPKFFCITSGKGGVGKTSLAVNLAFALAEEGLQVLLVDGDLGLANVDVLLNLEVMGTLRDIIDRGADPLGTVIQVHPCLAILPASSGVPDLANLGPDDQDLLGEVLQGLAAPFQYVLVDTAAGLGPSVLWLNAMAHYSLVVLTPDPTAITDAYALIKVMSQHYQRHHFLVVLNWVQGEREARQTFDTLNRAAARFLAVHLEYLGCLPSDPAVKRAVRAQAPFVQRDPDSLASLAVRTLATRLMRLPLGQPVNEPGGRRVHVV